MRDLITTGAIAGVAIGDVFQRSDLCFRSAWRGLIEHRYRRSEIRVLGVGMVVAAQPNVSSWVVVASIIAGIAAARAVQLRVVRRPAADGRVEVAA